MAFYQELDHVIVRFPLVHFSILPPFWLLECELVAIQEFF